MSYKMLYLYNSFVYLVIHFTVSGFYENQPDHVPRAGFLKHLAFSRISINIILALGLVLDKNLDLDFNQDISGMTAVKVVQLFIFLIKNPKLTV